MIKFKATVDQVLEIGANAVNASFPMGMGMLQYDSRKVYTKSDLELVRDCLSLDYVGGRMVKLSIARPQDDSPEVWTFRGFSQPDSEYQSWSYKYPTWRSLAESVPGVEVLSDGGEP